MVDLFKELEEDFPSEKPTNKYDRKFYQLYITNLDKLFNI